MDAHDELNIDEILLALRTFKGVYEKEMVEAAVERRSEIIPRLIEILHNLIDDPTPYLETEERFDHLYAVMLLGHLKATEAHRTIIDLFSLPEDILDPLFDDTTTSDLPGILLRTCGGSLGQIKAMALNRKVNDYCRNSALQAMTYAVVEGIVTREAVLAFFGTLFTGDETDAGSDFWGLLACNVHDLCPEGYLTVIRNAYDDGLISPQIIAYKDFESAIILGKEAMLDRLTINYERFTLIDIHKSMSWWACFQDDDDTESPPDLSDRLFDMPSVNRDSAPKKINPKAKKRKRKQVKASKRKNRR